MTTENDAQKTATNDQNGVLQQAVDAAVGAEETPEEQASDPFVQKLEQRAKTEADSQSEMLAQVNRSTKALFDYVKTLEDKIDGSTRRESPQNEAPRPQDTALEATLAELSPEDATALRRLYEQKRGETSPSDPDPGIAALAEKIDKLSKQVAPTWEEPEVRWLIEEGKVAAQALDLPIDWSNPQDLQEVSKHLVPGTDLMTARTGLIDRLKEINAARQKAGGPQQQTNNANPLLNNAPPSTVGAPGGNQQALSTSMNDLVAELNKAHSAGRISSADWADAMQSYSVESITKFLRKAI